MVTGLLQRVCLHPTTSLRRQLLVSYGSACFLALASAVALACFYAHRAGQIVLDRTNSMLREQVVRSLVRSTRQVSEQFSGKMDSLEGAAQLLTEMTRDRIVGYPDLPGWQDDVFVPFFDVKSQSNRYPLQSPPLPLDWNITLNVDKANAYVHLGERASLLSVGLISTASGSYLMQGSCDPSITDTHHAAYFPNCTEANNNLTTGGVVSPSPTNKWIHEKVSDLAVLMKAVWEGQLEIALIGLYLQNSGAGASVSFPGFMFNASEPPYVSRGCDWMREINNLTSKPFGTEQEIHRCHPAGVVVPQREFNPLEREWYQTIVKSSDQMIWYGPYTAAHGSLVMVSVGRSIYDRRTGALIGTLSLDILSSDLNSILKQARLQKSLQVSEMAIVWIEDSTVFADTSDSTLSLGATAKVWDAGIHILREEYEQLRDGFNFSQPWTRAQLDEAYKRNYIFSRQGHILSAYPLPAPPSEYDPTYRPQFMILQVISSDAFDVIHEMGTKIEQDSRHITVVSIGIGIIGLLLMTAIIFCVSRILTQPLLWIERLSWNIVNHTDTRSDQVLNVSGESDHTAIVMCTPRTEITELVDEFRSMIKGFSGSGASNVAVSRIHEIRNLMTWRSDFHECYSQPTEKAALSRSGSTSVSTEESVGYLSTALQGDGGLLGLKTARWPQEEILNSSSTVLAAPKKNIGSNINTIAGNLRSKDILLTELDTRKIRPHRSALFWWIVALIVFPLLITNVLISAIVYNNIHKTVPSWVEIVQVASFGLEKYALNATAWQNAQIAMSSIEEITRDLYVLTRVAGWLVFGGINQSVSFTDIEQATEECKVYPDDLKSCPFFESDRAPCACEWEDLNNLTCLPDTRGDARYLQRSFFASEARDADPITGDRLRSIYVSYPQYDYSPQTTLWWNTTEELPGSPGGVGTNEIRYGTTFDRIRTSSALSIVEVPIYNYATSLGRRKHDFGTYVAFEADGTIVGYAGCDYSYALFAHWQASFSNLASLIAPLLCPDGKYGFDPRCRNWYDTGRKNYSPARTSLVITPPYEFVEGRVATSATSPIANPSTGEYVGQALMDFDPSGIQSALYSVDEPISFLITPYYDEAGGDTVIGPDRNASGLTSADILDLLFPYDIANSANRLNFTKSIFPSLTSGGADCTNFIRTTEDGIQEVFVLAYQPVYVPSFLPLCPDDFACGANLTQELVYSLGIANYEQALRQPFQDVEGDVTQELESLRVNCLISVALGSLLFTLFTFYVTFFVTRPVLTLHRVVQIINAGKVDNDVPPLIGGSREVHRIYNSFVKLIKIVRMSNNCFFSGNLTIAHEIIADALHLFRKINDTKAIGIACNNLGNTLYAILHDSLDTIKLLDDERRAHCFDEAIRHYDESIRISQESFASAFDSVAKADFACQLADRLFNRGLFLLSVHFGDLTPRDTKEQALVDLAKAKELDYDVRDLWLERKLLLKNATAYFERLIRRIHGLIDFYEDIEVRALWDPQDLVKDADELLSAAWNEKEAPLFDDMTGVGRRQQLEAAAIRVELLAGSPMEARRSAMRMFAEDEFILETAFASAANALLQVMHEDEEYSWSASTKSLIKQDLRTMLKVCKNQSVDLGKCLVIGLEIHQRFEGSPLLEELRENCLHLYDRRCLRDDYVGIVAATTKGDFNVDLGLKEENEGRQRAALELATNSTSSQVWSILPFAIQMSIASPASIDNDTFILLITDGMCCDPTLIASMRSQIELLNRERGTKIHVLILGMDVEEAEVVDRYKMLATVSKLSLYLDLTVSNIDGVFDWLGRVIAGRTAPSCFQCLTMEKF